MPRLLEQICHLPRRIIRDVLGLLDTALLAIFNRIVHSKVVAPGGPVVSLTTHGERAQTVYIAIESIGRGKVLPSRLILWVDEQEFLHSPPAAIRRLERRGLEVRQCENYRAHKKYLPYVESESNFAVPLVTADDDILYPRTWLRDLMRAHRQHPESVQCFFAGTIQFSSDSGVLVMDGKSCRSTEESICHHPIGLAGILHPPEFLNKLKQAGQEFQSCCPRNCDMWFHVIALRTGFKFRQIVEELPYLAFQSIPKSQRTAMKGVGIDVAIAATYRESDIAVLKTACSMASR